MYLNAQRSSRTPANGTSVTCSDSEQIFSLVSLPQGVGCAQLPRRYMQGEVFCPGTCQGRKKMWPPGEAKEGKKWLALASPSGG